MLRSSRLVKAIPSQLRIVARIICHYDEVCTLRVCVHVNNEVLSKIRTRMRYTTKTAFAKNTEGIFYHAHILGTLIGTLSSRRLRTEALGFAEQCRCNQFIPKRLERKSLTARWLYRGRGKLNAYHRLKVEQPAPVQTRHPTADMVSSIDLRQSV